MELPLERKERRTRRDSSGRTSESIGRRNGCRLRACAVNCDRAGDGPIVLRSTGPMVHWSYGPLVLLPTGPTAHWSYSSTHWSYGPLVLRPTGPTAHWSYSSTHWSYGPLVLRPTGPMAHWSYGPLVLRPMGPRTNGRNFSFMSEERVSTKPL